MNIPETYDYLVRARRDLWPTLEGVPDEVLSRPLLDGSRLHCIKDLVFHVSCLKTEGCGTPSVCAIRRTTWARSAVAEVARIVAIGAEGGDFSP